MRKSLFCLGVMLLGVVACRAAEPALFVRVHLAQSLEATQLRFSLQSASGEVLGPIARPESPGPVLDHEQSARLVLPSTAAQEPSWTLTVEALEGEEVLSSRTVPVTLSNTEDVEVDVTLEAPPVVVDPPVEACPGGCAPGLRCVEGACVCTPDSCDGCCEGNICRTGDAPTSCGAGGGACQVCPVGDACVQGACSGCQATCATGCCLGATCTTPSAAACGAGGGACQPCDALRADGCSASGECQCGSGAPCGEGQRCVGGSCVCDATSCAAGCCDGTQCVVRSLTSCGIAGSTCTSCDSALADNCGSDGVCRCGGSAPCEMTQRCEAGVCVCDATTCPNGCCDGNTCEVPGVSTCGRAGAACTDCSQLRADTCSATGECLCGAGAPCGPSQKCVGGTCVCDPATCAGCCDGAQCLPGNLATSCGVNGATCTACHPDRADGCGPQGCQCGSSAACTPGSRCESGTCVCDAQTCGGCCDGAVCHPGTSKGACGANGAACVSCKGNRQCQMNQCTP